VLFSFFSSALSSWEVLAGATPSVVPRESSSEDGSVSTEANMDESAPPKPDCAGSSFEDTGVAGPAEVSGFLL
jgi:hypothetical protein